MDVDNINFEIIPKLKDNIDITWVSSFLKSHMTINTQCIRYILSRWDENTIGSICIIYYDNLVNDKEKLSKISWPVL